MFESSPYGRPPPVAQVLVTLVIVAVGMRFMWSGASSIRHGALPWSGVPILLVGLTVVAGAISGLVKAIRHQTDDRAPLPGGPVDGDRGFDLSDLTFSDDPRGTARPRGAALGTSPPPGWYADPAGSGRRRWWDGQVWTDHLT